MNTIQVNLKNQIIGDQNPCITISNRFSQEFANKFECKNGDQEIVAQCNLSPADCIKIQLTDRVHVNDSDIQTTIELKEIFVDDINLQHIILEGIFYPDYDYNFFNEHKPDNRFKPGTKMYTNGVFELEVIQPVSKFLVNSYEKRS